MTDHHQGLTLWAGSDAARRKEILSALKADESLASHDWAALPPELRSAIIAGIQPPEPEAAAEEPTTGRGRHKRGDD